MSNSVEFYKGTYKIQGSSWVEIIRTMCANDHSLDKVILSAEFRKTALPSRTQEQGGYDLSPLYTNPELAKRIHEMLVTLLEYIVGIVLVDPRNGAFRVMETGAEEGCANGTLYAIVTVPQAEQLRSIFQSILQTLSVIGLIHYHKSIYNHLQRMVYLQSSSIPPVVSAWVQGASMGMEGELRLFYDKNSGSAWDRKSVLVEEFASIEIENSERYLVTEIPHPRLSEKQIPLCEHGVILRPKTLPGTTKSFVCLLHDGTMEENGIACGVSEVC